MKLIITADDFAITSGVADGIVAAARDGLLTQTGLFANSDCAEYAVNRLKKYPHVLLGIDLNLCAGYPCTDPKLIPSLVDENGHFLTSSVHRRRDGDPEHAKYEEIYLEYENQIKRFIELTGKLPGYIQGHAWGNADTAKAETELAIKYGIPETMDLMNKYVAQSENSFIEAVWARPVMRPDKTQEFSVMTQIENDPWKFFVEGKIEWLDYCLKNDLVCELHTHSGYVDRDLIFESSYTTVRCMEQAFICSDELKNWVKENNVQMINFADLYKGE